MNILIQASDYQQGTIGQQESMVQGSDNHQDFRFRENASNECFKDQASMQSVANIEQPTIQPAELIVKLEKEMQIKNQTIKILNNRIGDDILDSDDSLLSDDDHQFETKVNTREYQIDQQFGKIFYYLTNVCTIQIS